jgi:hypothetical protein
MILADVSTWPAPLLEYLASEYEMFLAHARSDRDTMDAYLAPKDKYICLSMYPPNPHFRAREHAAQTVLDLLQGEPLRGWHCSRLTAKEVDRITRHGMQPPDLAILRERIDQIQSEGLIAYKIAVRLRTENDADHTYRKGRIWFCFFEPRSAGQHGIERFFRRWGGEALYVAHEEDETTGEVLRTIGRPCLIEVDVPIAAIRRVTYLGEKVIRRFLLHNGFDTRESWEHEDHVSDPISAASILRFVFHPDPEFARLTDCDSWDPPLV